MWVLILTSGYLQQPPAIIGGYASLQEAEGAGLVATFFENPTDPSDLPLPLPYWNRFSVIPGAACKSPGIGVHSEVWHNGGHMVRTTRRFDGGKPLTVTTK